jgi:hypothetical protein
VFGNDTSVWDKFARAEERIDQEAIETEVDAAMRGEEGDASGLDAKIAALPASGAGNEDALAQLKAKMLADKEAKQKLLEAKKDDDKK